MRCLADVLHRKKVKPVLCCASDEFLSTVVQNQISFGVKLLSKEVSKLYFKDPESQEFRINYRFTLHVSHEFVVITKRKNNEKGGWHSPVWVRRCRVKLLLWENFSLQTLHSKGFSPGNKENVFLKVSNSALAFGFSNFQYLPECLRICLNNLLFHFVL